MVFGVVRDNAWLGHHDYTAYSPATRCSSLFADAALISRTDAGWHGFVQTLTSEVRWVSHHDLEAALLWHGRGQPQAPAPYSVEALRELLPELSGAPTTSELMQEFSNLRRRLHPDPSDLTYTVWASTPIAWQDPWICDQTMRSVALVVVADLDREQLSAVSYSGDTKHHEVVACAELDDPAGLEHTARMFDAAEEARSSANRAMREGWSVSLPADRWETIDLVTQPRRDYFDGFSEMDDLGRPAGFPQPRTVRHRVARCEAEKEAARRQRSAECAGRTCIVRTPDRWCSRECWERHVTGRARETRRYDCQGCGKALIGRQERWCSNRCATIWFNPTYLDRELWYLQHGRCGFASFPSTSA